ncbi:MAG: hypothetical protein AAGF77_00290 [Bacteroidota bacterium]
MKISIVLLGLLSLTITPLTAQKSVLAIPPNSTLELDYVNYPIYQLQLKNKGSKKLEVQVRQKATGTYVSGFGLSPFGKVVVTVKDTNHIMFTNNDDRLARLTISITEMEITEKQREFSNPVWFVLVNSSTETIPLFIPNVMNPNLSPNSKSRVALEIGQKLFFRHKGKRYVLLIVDQNMKSGAEVEVSQLLQDRKMALGLQ